MLCSSVMAQNACLVHASIPVWLLSLMLTLLLLIPSFQTLGRTPARPMPAAQPTNVIATLATIAACPSLRYTDPRSISSPRVIGDKPWSFQRKFVVWVDGAPYVLKTTLANFEIVYSLVAKILQLDHARFEPRWSSLHGNVVVLNPYFYNVSHSWNTCHACTNVSNRAAFHVLYNDYLVGYSDRMPNCHLVNGSVVPIDQDSGSYTAVLPPQTDRQYEKHLLHNRMLQRDPDSRRAFRTFIRCNRSRYGKLAACLPGVFAQFPLHSTHVEHVLFRFNEILAFACP